MSTETMQLPTATPPALNRPPSLHEPKVEVLAQMFPEIDAEVLALFLSHSGGDVERAVVAILETSPPAPTQEDNVDIDAQIAKFIQLENDEAVARVVHAALQKELKEEETKQQLATKMNAAATSTVSAATTAKKFLLERIARARAASAAKREGGSSTSTHRTSLLDAQADPEASYDMAPLSSRLINAPITTVNRSSSAEYAPPALVAEAPPTPAPTPTTAASPAADPFPTTAATTPATTTPAATPGARAASAGTLAEGSAERRYSSRMDRARSANSMLRHQRAVIAPAALPPPALAPLVADGGSAPPNLMDAAVAPLVLNPAGVAVPEGELI